MELPTLLLWNVNFANRVTHTIGRRSLYLNTASLSSAEASAVLRAAGMSDILKHRHLFTEAAPNTKDPHNVKAFDSPFISHYEDEAGNPLTYDEFMEIVTGRQTVIMGHPESAMRFGPTKMANHKEWNSERADTVDHFLEVVKYLSESKWIRTKVSFQYTVMNGPLFQPAVLGPNGPAPGTASKPINFQCPDLYTINTILTLIRQLIHSDNLFKKSFEIYIHHCHDHGKLAFAHYEKALFDQTLAKPPILFSDQYTGDDVLRLFLYEFGLMHLPKPSQRAAFRQMIDAHGRERTFMAFHSTLTNLTASATRLAPLISQDLEFWINTEKHAGPNRVSFHELLRNDPSAPEPPLVVGETRIEVSTK